MYIYIYIYTHTCNVFANVALRLDLSMCWFVAFRCTYTNVAAGEEIYCTCTFLYVGRTCMIQLINGIIHIYIYTHRESVVGSFRCDERSTFMC